MCGQRRGVIVPGSDILTPRFCREGVNHVPGSRGYPWSGRSRTSWPATIVLELPHTTDFEMLECASRALEPAAKDGGSTNGFAVAPLGQGRGSCLSRLHPASARQRRPWLRRGRVRKLFATRGRRCPEVTQLHRLAKRGARGARLLGSRSTRVSWASLAPAQICSSSRCWPSAHDGGISTARLPFSRRRTMRRTGSLVMS